MGFTFARVRFENLS